MFVQDLLQLSARSLNQTNVEHRTESLSDDGSFSDLSIEELEPSTSTDGSELKLGSPC